MLGGCGSPQVRPSVYAVTNRQVMVVQNGWRRRMASAYLNTLLTLIKEAASNGRGTFDLLIRNRHGHGEADGPYRTECRLEMPPCSATSTTLIPYYRLVSDQREQQVKGALVGLNQVKSVFPLLGLDCRAPKRRLVLLW